VEDDDQAARAAGPPQAPAAVAAAPAWGAVATPVDTRGGISEAAGDAGGAAGRAPPLRVQCFGGLRVTGARGEVSAEGAAGGYQAWAILAFLAAQPDGAATTEALCAAVWPDVAPDRAATARLSPALSRLRRTLQAQVPGLTGPVVVRGRNGHCWLDPAEAESDVQRFVRLCAGAGRLPPAEAAAVYEEARALYRGDLLARQAYEWVDGRERDGLTPGERYQRLYLEVSCRLADLYRRRGEPSRAVPVYRRVLAEDPTAEDVARELFRCYGELGDRAALLREYRHLRLQLRRAPADPEDADADDRDEQGEQDDPLYEPEAETVAVYREELARLDARAGGPPPERAGEDAAG
jgi:DNA-binding SARP family transcriptional activator